MSTTRIIDAGMLTILELLYDSLPDALPEPDIRHKLDGFPASYITDGLRKLLTWGLIEDAGDATIPPYGRPVKTYRISLAGMNTVMQDSLGEIALSANHPAVIRNEQPPDGFVGAMTITTSEEYRCVPRSTLQLWEETDKPERWKDPRTQEVYYPESWVRSRISKWKPRRNCKFRNA